MNSFQKLKGAAKMKRKGFTLIELLVVIAIIAMLLAILMPALNKVKKIAQRVVCGTNLKGLGTAQSVYSNDYEDQFVKQGGTATTYNWSRFTAGFDNSGRVWTNATAQLSVGASLYLLVREADVSPKSFVCGAGGQSTYDGKNSKGADLVELWDFGHPGVVDSAGQSCGKGPMEHVSYSYHQPYGPKAASGSSSASFAIMADRSPWFDPKLKEATITGFTADDFTGYVSRMGLYFDTTITPAPERYQIQVANAYPHSREGQNVAFGDGHSEYVKTSDVGVKHDNIYTRQNPVAAGTTSEVPIRCGNAALGLTLAPTFTPPGTSGVIAGVNNNAQYQPLTNTDSFLINDDDNTP
jgi:prepilin-type N-terminal cleavage/methylation domain-containing protein